MENKQIVRALRPVFNKPAFALLIFYLIMNAAVIGVAVVQIIILLAQAGMNVDPELVLEQAVGQIASNGLGYVIAYAIGAVALLAWKKPQFCFREIWKSSGHMNFLTMLILLCLTTGTQAIYEMVVDGVYNIFGLFGIEYGGPAISGAVDMNSFSMVFYTCILAPVGEEILFRGVALNALRPYGKKFAVLATAVFFGLYHGNLEQSVFAFAIGLLLGYVTVEYSLGWAVALHAFNNLVLCYLLPLVLTPISPFVAEFVLTILVWGCAIGGALILFFKRLEVGEYLLQKRIHPLCLKAFFSAPAVVIFMVIMGLNMALAILMQI